jgi:hypothetical protein
MQTQSKSFTAVGDGFEFSLEKGQSALFVVSGTFDQTWRLDRCTDGKNWAVYASTGSTATTTLTAETDRTRFRVRSVAEGETAGTMVVTVTDQVEPSRRLLKIPAAIGKVGGTAGWVVAAAANTSLVTVPAGVTAGKLVIPVAGLVVGDIIRGFYATGQIESAGNTATFDLELRKHTAAAADVDDASVASATQLSVTADTAISSSNTRKSDLVEVVGADESFYLLVTVTTAASTDVALQSVTLELQA